MGRNTLYWLKMTKYFWRKSWDEWQQVSNAGKFKLRFVGIGRKPIFFSIFSTTLEEGTHNRWL